MRKTHTDMVGPRDLAGKERIKQIEGERRGGGLGEGAKEEEEQQQQQQQQQQDGEEREEQKDKKGRTKCALINDSDIRITRYEFTAA